MLRLMVIIVSAVLCPSVLTQSENHHRFVCYHTNWAQYRPAPVTFKPEDIDPFLCTHIIYSFAKIDEASLLLAPYEWNDESTEWSVGNYEKFTDLKKQNPNLKLLLAVGGWTHGVAKFSPMVATATKRQAFITHAISFLRDRNFDGLDLDWEFPAARGSPSGDKDKFTILCQELRAAFEAEAQNSGRPRLLLSAAVAAGHTYIDAGYEIKAVSNALDFVSLMAYDLRGSWESVTGHHTTLYAGSSDSGDYAKLVWEYAVNKWLDGGCPPSKLNMGFGAYGRGFTLAGSDTSIGATTTGPSSAGTYTREPGFLAYYEICEKLATGFTRVFDDERKVPYATGDGQWVGYDDVESIQAKADFLKSRGIGGGMVWAMDLDDFKGDFCGEGPWPILSAIKEALIGDFVEPSQLPVEPTSSNNPLTGNGQTDELGSTSSFSPRPLTTELPNIPTSTQTNGGNSDGDSEGEAEGGIDREVPFSCEGRPDGTYDDPTDCISFYQCWGNGQHSGKNSCGNDLVFNPDCLCCDWPENYHCSETNSDPGPTDSPHSTDARTPGSTNPDSTDGYVDGDDHHDHDHGSHDHGDGDGDIGSDDGDHIGDDDDDNVADFSCEGRPDGTYDDPTDCISFYQCWGNGQHSGKNSCGNDLVFNPDCLCCDWPENYHCSETPGAGSTNPDSTDDGNGDNDGHDHSHDHGNGDGRDVDTGVGDDDNDEFSCEGRPDGTYADPVDCTGFYQCWGNGQHIAKNLCANDLVFNPNCLCCDWPANYDCPST